MVLRWGLLAMVLCFLVVTFGRSDDEKVDPKKVKAAREAILKLLDSKDIKVDAESLAKKHSLDEVMVAVFKPRANRRLEVGGKPGAIIPDHIDLKINAMSKIMMKKEVLAKESADLIKMLEVVKATAEVAQFLCPIRAPMGGKNPAQWQAGCTNMRKFSEALIAAIKEGDPPTVKARALDLYGTCTGCHSIFRD